jgi:pimeloyl-ACP methyl ester carboxylesterase
MSPRLLPALRFLRGWSRGPASDPDGFGVREEVIDVEVPASPTGPGSRVRAVRVVPLRDGGAAGHPLPGWVVLHGLTVPGIDHRSLRRFARALAGTGARVLLPEIPPWTRLDFAPEDARRIAAAAVAAQARDPAVAPGGVHLAGFSFGGPQALALAADPGVNGRLASVLAWGSYGRLDTTIRFGFTGEHRSSEGVEVLRPDPYARWISGANLLPTTPGFEGSDAVAEALHRVAFHSGEVGLDAFDPVLARFAAAVRAELPAGDRPLFDLFLPPGGGTPPRDAAHEVASALVRTAHARMPALDPLPGLGPIPVPVHLLHGRGDVLIPWSETERIDALIRPRTPTIHTTITGLFAHSGDLGGDRGLRALARRAREGARFVGALRRILGPSGVRE